MSFLICTKSDAFVLLKLDLPSPPVYTSILMAPVKLKFEVLTPNIGRSLRENSFESRIEA